MRPSSLHSVSVLIGITSKSNMFRSDGMMMILSPAKTLNLKYPFWSSKDEIDTTDPSCNSVKTNQLAAILKKKSKKDLKSLLQVSDNIASNVFKYYENFELDPTKRDQNEKIPASFAFDGPAYRGLDVNTCSSDTLKYLQSNLRIIDPFYGLLRPMDLIQPYRLEMTSKAILKDLSEETCDGHKSLSSWWSESINGAISKDLNEKTNAKYLINLASEEYAAAVNLDLLPSETNYIKVVFQQEGKVIAVHAKRARGLMARYIAENQITDVNDVKNFNVDGYHFMKDRSDENTFVFDRPKGESISNKRKTNNDVAESKKGRRR